MKVRMNKANGPVPGTDCSKQARWNCLAIVRRLDIENNRITIEIPAWVKEEAIYMPIDGLPPEVQSHVLSNKRYLKVWINPTAETMEELHLEDWRRG